MKKLVNHFWDYLFHPSIRKYVHPQGKAISYRYPSPANAKLEPMLHEKQTDYKTPYEHSHYNVRYDEPTPMQKADTIEYIQAAPLNSDPIKRLKKTGLLKKGEENDADKVAAAKVQFQQKFGYSAEQSVYKNDGDYNILRSKNREDISAYIKSFYQEVRHASQNSYCPTAIKSTIHDPEVVPLESYDMFCGPHFQSDRVSNEYLIELSIEDRASKKQIDMYAGDARFWKAIDASYEMSEVEKVQTHVGDRDPTGFELRRGKVEMEFNSEGEIVDLHPTARQ